MWADNTMQCQSKGRNGDGAVGDCDLLYRDVIIYTLSSDVIRIITKVSVKSTIY